MEAQIEKYCKELKLSGLVKGYKTIEFKNIEQYIHDLLLLEVREREINRINRGIKSAGFKVIKSLHDFTWTNNIALPNTITIEKSEKLSFLDKKENLIFMGSVGTGKTHLATALTLEACKKGKRAKFYTAAELTNLLLEKYQKGTLNAYMKTLNKLDLIVIDEIGFVPLHKDGAELLFQVISDSYEKRSLIITSNLEFGNWNTIFGDNRLTAAIVDRLIHHAHIFVFSGESYRLKQSMNRQQKRL